MWWKRRSVVHDARPTFVCEQVGAWETTLKEALARLFVLQPTVDAAYLARVDYGDGQYNVALCLNTTGDTDDPTLVEGIRSVFAPLFRTDSHLDIMFLTPESEEQVRRVCLPFYLRGTPGSPEGTA